MATSYKDGMKYVDGHAYKPLVLKTHLSRSNPGREPYRTLLWEDGLTSCNCQGWATHKRCHHTLDLELEAKSGALGPGIKAVRDLAARMQAARVSDLRELLEAPVNVSDIRRRQQRAAAKYTIDP